ncbi:MAG: B12-binding domain-containing radical SAM protein [Elusimicrobia bacterium RIFOXYB2_FULL_48_7]|nr:MAG: B12-binding domain-containing radical SAM protein [Elusimicrobia bacterium RIFOXYB2_FULL_48_7]
MEILLVYPEIPDTFWSFKHALKFIHKKASSPPLGLLTVAAMLPKDWDTKLIDMNVAELKDKDITRADYVFIGSMSIQKKSAQEVIARCKRLGTKIVAGGPLFTSHPDKFDEVDHLVLNEAEITLPMFLADLAGTPKHIYNSEKWADISATPEPLWNLINMKKYASLCMQYSRGCPFNCDFCDVTALYGHSARTKSSAQVVRELEHIHAQGWRGNVFFVDDNFIGNKTRLKSDILPAVIEWTEKMKHPFTFDTQASINMADDEELMNLMARAGFDAVFIGIETPNEESLAECSKHQNKNRDLNRSIEIIQKHGFEVQAGFIVGFDHDPLSIFERQVRFIQKSGIVTAMVGILNAPRGTTLYDRLKKENRLLNDFTGDNTDNSINFIPAMELSELTSGYRHIVSTIYSPKNYYSRVTSFLKIYKSAKVKSFSLKMVHVSALARSIMLLGIFGKERWYYWKLMFWSLFTRPQKFPKAVSLAIYGYHFRKVFEN